VPSDQLGGPTGTDTGHRGFPWGVLGLVGLVGLFGRKRG
jgi:LPXTG-motif cell wall-anchored protein